MGIYKYSFDLKKTYLAMIENSVGSRIFQNFYVVVKNSKRKDVLQKGKFSCAFFVSVILRIFNLISSPHCTVESTLKDLKKSGWFEIEISKRMPKGTVVLWQKKEGHYHLGFYFGQKMAISNSPESRVPVIHHWTFNNSRKIIKAYSHQFLSN